jgi:hypothetical protein
MAISGDTDILYRLSTKSGSAGNSLSQGDPNASLGKYISLTDWSATALNNLFDNVSGSENAASDVEYRCIFVLNNHGSLTLQGPVAYISAEVAGGCSVAIGVDTTAASLKGASSAQAVSAADESSAPAGISFSSPTTVATGLALGDIAAGYCKAIWVRRTAANTVAVDADGFTLTIAGGTAA